jgi:sec-independent protein translocase protein TatA
MFGLSVGHMVILGVVVLLFGSRRLPELGSALGKGMNAFKKGLSGEEDLQSSSGHKEQLGAIQPDAVLPSEKKS